MSITDSAMRTVVRAEVGAEFYSVPQRYLVVDGTLAPDEIHAAVMGRLQSSGLLDGGAG